MYPSFQNSNNMIKGIFQKHFDDDSLNDDSKYDIKELYRKQFKERISGHDFYHQCEPLQNIDESSVLSDSYSVQIDAVENLENRMIQEYSDISSLNKQYMLLWNEWINRYQRKISQSNNKHYKAIKFKFGFYKHKQKFSDNDQKQKVQSPVQSFSEEQLNQLQKMKQKALKLKAEKMKSGAEEFRNQCEKYLLNMKYRLPQVLRTLPQKKLSDLALRFVAENVEKLGALQTNFEVHFNILQTLELIDEGIIKKASTIIRVWHYQNDPSTKSFFQ